MPFLTEVRDFITSFSYPDNLFGFWGNAPSDSGVMVNELNAMQSATVAGCIRIISAIFASTPLHVYEVDDKGGHNIVWDHELEDIFNSKFNPETGSYMAKETGMVHLLLSGNTYFEKAYDNGGRLQLYQRSPFRTFPYRRMNGSNELVFKTTDGALNGRERVIAFEDMVHIKGMSLDGLVGMNPIKSIAREVIGLDLAARSYGARLFANDSTPSGVLTTDKILKDDRRKQLETSWKSAHNGANAHQFAVLDGGLKWEKISLTAEESQFLMTRELQRAEIAQGIFGVPEFLVGGKEQTKANMEQQMLQFLTFTMMGWFRRWENELENALLPTLGRNANRYIIRFDTSEMKRGDYETTLKGIAVGRQWGIYTANEGRKLLGLNPDDDSSSSKLWKPVNMQDADKPIAAPEASPQENPSGGATEPEPEPTGRQLLITKKLFRDAFQRTLAREKRDSAFISKAFAPCLFAVADLFTCELDAKFTPGDLPSQEVLNFLTDYMGGMAKRAKDWADQDLQPEHDRAMKAVKIAVSRDVATRKAKEK